MLHGGDAQKAWQRFARHYPSRAHGLEEISTYHTSRQAFWHKDPAVRDARQAKLSADFATAAAILRSEAAA